MNIELWLVFLPAISWLCFALGGTKISETIEGKKWIRRFVLPFVFGLCVFFGGFAWWKALLVAGIACGAFHLGYGDKSPWPMKLLTFASYAIISLPVGVSHWNALVFVGCAVMFLSSNLSFSRGTFVWKICEGAFGCLVGVSLAFLLSGNGLIWN